MIDVGTGAGLDALLACTRERIERIAVGEAFSRLGEGAPLVDIRSTDQRAGGGVIAGALWISRNVLEWRLDPGSEWSHPTVDGAVAPVMVICAEGFQSSLAVANLGQIGVGAVDIEGGFAAWAAAGLPVECSLDPPAAGCCERLRADP